MRLKIKHKVRTSSSEQWTLFDLDQRDETGGPQNIGKLDLHYDPDMTYATLLIWSELAETLETDTIQAIIDDLVDEIIEPIGVAADYSLDFFTPSIETYKFYTNFDDELDEEDEEDEEEDENEGSERNGLR